MCFDFRSANTYEINICSKQKSQVHNMLYRNRQDFLLQITVQKIHMFQSPVFLLLCTASKNMEITSMSSSLCPLCETCLSYVYISIKKNQRKPGLNLIFRKYSILQMILRHKVGDCFLGSPASFANKTWPPCYSS